MARTLKIDFVSDVMCPWCIVGLGGLEEALRRIGMRDRAPPGGQHLAIGHHETHVRLQVGVVVEAIRLFEPIPERRPGQRLE